MSDLISLAKWLQHYSILGMVVVFVLIFVTTYWPSRKADVERNGQIPLHDDQPEAQS